MQNVVQLESVRRPPFDIDTRRYARCVEVSKRMGAEDERYTAILGALITEEQAARIVAALSPLSEAVVP